MPPPRPLRLRVRAVRRLLPPLPPARLPPSFLPHLSPRSAGTAPRPPAAPPPLRLRGVSSRPASACRREIQNAQIKGNKNAPIRDANPVENARRDVRGDRRERAAPRAPTKRVADAPKARDRASAPDRLENHLEKDTETPRGNAGGPRRREDAKRLRRARAPHEANRGGAAPKNGEREEVEASEGDGGRAENREALRCPVNQTLRPETNRSRIHLPRPLRRHE